MRTGQQGACLCGCGEGTQTSCPPPSPRTTRPGLSAITYRAGTHGQFLESMLRPAAATASR